MKLIEEDVIETVCRHYGITEEVIKGKSRKMQTKTARFMAMYLIRNNSDLSFQDIGIMFGRRDHSSVIHACRQFADIMFTNKRARAIYSRVTADLFSSDETQTYNIDHVFRSA